MFFFCSICQLKIVHLLDFNLIFNLGSRCCPIEYLGVPLLLWHDKSRERFKENIVHL